MIHSKRRTKLVKKSEEGEVKSNTTRIRRKREVSDDPYLYTPEMESLIAEELGTKESVNGPSIAINLAEASDDGRTIHVGGTLKTDNLNLVFSTVIKTKDIHD